MSNLGGAALLDGTDDDFRNENTDLGLAAPTADDEEVGLLMAGLKKKKKKKKAVVAEEEDKESTPEPVQGGAAAEAVVEVESKGESVSVSSSPAVAWANSDRDYNYTELLERVFSLLREKNPNLAERKRHAMPPPLLHRIGTRKTMWANFAQICSLMHRQPEHVMSFVLAELGTEGSIDGSQRLVIKGRYMPKQTESLLKKYIVEYVTCHMCRNADTGLTRDSVTRLYFIQCESCGSSRSVAPIKAGFHATMRAERRKTKAA